MAVADVAEARRRAKIADWAAQGRRFESCPRRDTSTHQQPCNHCGGFHDGQPKPWLRAIGPIGPHIWRQLPWQVRRELVLAVRPNLRRNEEDGPYAPDVAPFGIAVGLAPAHQVDNQATLNHLLR